MDLISNLPDGVLCHILSFLTTKEAALTSILCKRWRNLFAFVPNLDFHDSFILYSGDNPQLFTDFVDRVLALQGNSPINKFSLNCVGVDSDRIDAWIRNVMVRGVSELKLSILTGTRDNYSLFPEIFESEKLVKLEIHNGDISLDGSIFLPMLKTLVLEYVLLSVDKFEILLHALPALEELALLSIRWKDWNIGNIADVTVSSASLKTLTIDFIGSVSYTFDTPSLVYFCYSDYLAEDYSIAKMENLLEARISLQVPENEIKRARAQNNDWLEDDEDIVRRFAIVGKLMNHMQNVQYLDLCPNTIEVLSLCCESLPVFNNLKSLTIKSHRTRGWQAMPVLLRNCPHLETLVIEGLLHHFTDKCGDACGCVPRVDKGRSLTSCPVKVLDIKGFQGTMKEIYMIEHFLDYFLCLKEIKIFYEGENCPLQLRVPEMSEVIVEMTEHYNKKTGQIQYKKFALIVENVEKKKAERFSQLSQKDSGSASGSNHLSREEFNRLVLEETPVRKGRVFGLGRVLDTLNSASSSANFCDPELVEELQVMREQLTQKDAEIAELKSAVEFLKTYITENFQPPPGDSLPQ